jgi:hypothetical protein
VLHACMHVGGIHVVHMSLSPEVVPTATNLSGGFPCIPRVASKAQQCVHRTPLHAYIYICISPHSFGHCPTDSIIHSIAPGHRHTLLCPDESSPSMNGYMHAMQRWLFYLAPHACALLCMGSIVQWMETWVGGRWIGAGAGCDR